ncbi:MAG: alpha/beta hydrolase [Methylococcales bacterium]
MKIPRVMTFLLIYLLILLAVFLLQRKIMYFPARFTQEQQKELMTDLNLQPWPSANELRGIMSKTPLTDAKGTVLVFHGNAGAALHRTYYIDALQNLGYQVIIAEYPGYGVRSGTPSEAVLIKDGIATAKMALHAFKEPLFLCGESLGTGVVAGIVASHEVSVKGLLLITPFDAMTKVAQHHYWYFLPRWLLLDKFNNVPKFRNFQGNIAVLLAEQDEVIPNRRTMALFDAISERKQLWRFENANHNSLPLEHWRLWWQEVMKFIDH